MQIPVKMKVFRCLSTQNTANPGENDGIQVPQDSEILQIQWKMKVSRCQGPPHSEKSGAPAKIALHAPRFPRILLWF